MPWRGPKLWRGEATLGGRDFDFAALPWLFLFTRGKSFEGVECVKTSDTRRVFRVESNGQILYAKRYLVSGVRRRVGNWLGGCKAKNEFHIGLAMLKAGIPTPLPLAYAEHSRPHEVKGFKKFKTIPPANYLVTREWPNQGAVRDWLALHPEVSEAMMRRVGAFMARAHGIGFYHDDCSSGHLLVSPDFDPDSLCEQEATERDATGALIRTRAKLKPRKSEHEAPDELTKAALGRFGLAFIDVDNGTLEDSPIALKKRWINLFQILRSLSEDICNATARRAFIESYLQISGLKPAQTIEEAKREINAVAARKIGKKVI